MSSSYKKLFKNIPNASQYLKTVPFSTDPAHKQFGAVLNFKKGSSQENKDAYAFLQSSVKLFKTAFGIHVVDQIDSDHAIYYVSNPIQAPIIRSKKKRAQKHARLVALSNLNRTNVR